METTSGGPEAGGAESFGASQAMLEAGNEWGAEADVVNFDNPEANFENLEVREKPLNPEEQRDFGAEATRLAVVQMASDLEAESQSKEKDNLDEEYSFDEIRYKIDKIYEEKGLANAFNKEGEVELDSLNTPEENPVETTLDEYALAQIKKDNGELPGKITSGEDEKILEGEYGEDWRENEIVREVLYPDDETIKDFKEATPESVRANQEKRLEICSRQLGQILDKTQDPDQLIRCIELKATCESSKGMSDLDVQLDKTMALEEEIYKLAQSVGEIQQALA